ncbi:hypothetical protein TRM7557_01269 [Tritonibacter multivorans]|uniref:Uncharacterized protein n=1 Tax=Tritonibacter multivorans TaxID=928856 RepID=A0A0P1GN96_9RHOB|nr:hypothetical protein [Tritonibacter multivorans]MDA7422681.1 hypothetical protein [Tritonibacter multivorans]CUH77220.1 hypothetical protein TRM7557_01269 [Tritonibacter multivorans]SFD52637.1 hypothetical protein SAMN04488049_11563 [Tritonibacter multivorans]
MIPNDWQAFVANERLMTRVNGEFRQDTRAGDMILTFRDLVFNTLSDADEKRFLYKGGMQYLIEDHKIARGQVLMS